MTTDHIQSPAVFWEEFYLTKRTSSSGRATAALQRIAVALTPGLSLDLGASHGDDVIWLAQQGWHARGCDISQVAVEQAQARAAELGLAQGAQFERCDLSVSLPEGGFDLITALYLQSPVALARAAILGQATRRLRPGGHLLVLSHAAPPPWSPQATSSTIFPTVAEELDAIGAPSAELEVIEAQVVTRPGRGPDGAGALLEDNLVLVQRNRA
ncbi:class I SAM-dependent methyltransferase [Cereibacter changlensis JA139]|uniref:Class I SAM-dependent methyltransferase n=2 Tax=Cereibacter changlensis TaxID=402884 RepID=A0A2T4JWV4_9RHOB|nr:class I SAM-dependent methyltransferase [Cereibacter changlensis]PTE22365.1 class I SAM-dependent methyltransferase [Cereibacter changlensis JA139]PZX54990.1 methyltransferase family protein [Cereibacter changlensis]